MQQIKGRVLPGPWLNYKTGRAGQEETKAFKTGTSGVWNMNNFKFSGKIEVYLQQQLGFTCSNSCLPCGKGCRV